MFSDLVESVAVRKQTSKPWAVMASAIFQLACLLVAFLIPLIYTQALPTTIVNGFLLAPAPARPAARPPADVPAGVRRSARLLVDDVLHEPRAIPTTVKVFEEPQLPPESDTDLRTGDGRGDLGLFGVGRGGPAVAPPQPPAPVVTQRIKQGGVIEAARIISQAQPLYPTLARQAGVQGTVLLHAVIDKDGNVSELNVISGPPLLVRAALEAVRQWRYQPTLLNGEPVEVETTITVSFVLGR